MLYSTLVVAAVFTGLAAAQNSSSNLPPNFPQCCTPPTEPNSTVKQSYCNANTNTCVDICGTQADIAPQGNTCSTQNLQFKCECKNGTVPNMALYQQSVPALQCLEWFGQCVIAAGDGFESAEWKRQCESIRDSRCGNMTIQKSPQQSGAASGSGSTSLPSRTASGSGSGSPTATGSGAASSSNAAVAVAREFGLPVLAGGLVAVFGMAL